MPALTTNQDFTMKTLPKLLAALATVTLFGTGSSFAEYPDYVLKRIEHPNGPPTFAYVPVDKAGGYQEGHTVGLYRESRGVGRGRTIVERDETVVVDVPIHRGRGEIIYVPVRR